jgi:hypothetical protein
MAKKSMRRPFFAGIAVGALALVAATLIYVADSGPSGRSELAKNGLAPLASTIAESLASAFEISELEAQSRTNTDYRFLPNRRNMWVMNRRLGRIVHFRFLDTSKGTVERSFVAQVDQQRFPARDTTYKISERNITDLLWVCNRRTGDFQLWRRNVRDGRLVTDDQSVQAAAHLENAVIGSRP